jgi:hypothetical protein
MDDRVEDEFVPSPAAGSMDNLVQRCSCMVATVGERRAAEYWITFY